MRTILLTIIAIAAFTSSAFAARYDGVLAFANTSGASAAVKTSSAYPVYGFKTKTMTVTGVTLTSSPTSVTYKNYSGTILAQCGPSASGPWATCNQSQLASTPAVSSAAGQSVATTPILISWQDACNYIRLKWTTGTIGGKIRAWLHWTEN